MSFALGAVISIASATFSQDKKEPPAQLSADVLVSWAENRFEIGYVKLGEAGQLQFLLQPEADAVPAFMHPSPSEATLFMLRSGNLWSGGVLWAKARARVRHLYGDQATEVLRRTGCRER
jgi:hypothetical protein